eukprot:gene43505-54593_t
MTKIKVKIFPKIERRRMDKVNGIVVHQTNASTIQSTFHSYAHEGANGAHFLIDKDGTIYQTASLYCITNHVGRLQSRCFITKKCTATELQHVTTLEKIKSTVEKARAVHNNEYKKNFPDRYPWNVDSIGIEIVGASHEKIHNGQAELTVTLKVSMTEIYRHPHIGRKNKTEAST